MQELKPFLKMNDAFKKVVLVGDDVPPHVNEKGIVIMNIIDFMKDPEAWRGSDRRIGQRRAVADRGRFALPVCHGYKRLYHFM